jgi:hypothetical protein
MTDETGWDQSLEGSSRIIRRKIKHDRKMDSHHVKNWQEHAQDPEGYAGRGW